MSTEPEPPMIGQPKLSDLIQLLNARPPAEPTGLADSFREALFKFLRGERCNKLKPDVENNYLRCSAMPRVLDSLPRLRFAQTITDIVPIGTPNTIGEQLNFDVGHAIHYWWQNIYIANFTADAGFKLWGDWACGCNIVQKTTRPVDVCAACKVPWTYSEIEVKDDVLRYKGHPDGLLVVGEAAEPTVVLEIKTIGTQGFDALVEPVADHRRQVHPYMRSTGCRDVIFVYIDKGKQSLWKFQGGGFVTVGEPRVKVFHEQFNDALWDQMESGIVEFWQIMDRVKAA